MGDNMRIENAFAFTLSLKAFQEWSDGKHYDISPPVHGLLCCYSNNKSVICNPSSGRYFDLPDVTQASEFFLGFDPVCNVLKVLAMAKYDSCTETRVLTLIPDEEFSIISLPQEIEVENYFLYRSCDMLVTFNGKLAIARDENEDGALTIWNLEEDATTWCKKQFLVPLFREGFEEEGFKFIGTVGSSVHIYAPRYDSFLPRYESVIDQYVIYHDPNKQIVEKVRIEGDFRDFAGSIEPFLDYIENPALSPIGPPF
ncbi:unnamed protein product [Arabidopsis arenosa]|uniref:F-box associated beta-propeller type 3 domain-containing protein n=1 Tax=Arabidopsis arenosa TaxID=38785 RepID=A0A8S1ZUQ2_ARAAE|nr:unnamed protein product [Arabidopsis arenosa]